VQNYTKLTLGMRSSEQISLLSRSLHTFIYTLAVVFQINDDTKRHTYTQIAYNLQLAPTLSHSKIQGEFYKWDTF